MENDNKKGHLKNLFQTASLSIKKNKVEAELFALQEQVEITRTRNEELKVIETDLQHKIDVKTQDLNNLLAKKRKLQEAYDKLLNEVSLMESKLKVHKQNLSVDSNCIFKNQVLNTGFSDSERKLIDAVFKSDTVILQWNYSFDENLLYIELSPCNLSASVKIVVYQLDEKTFKSNKYYTAKYGDKKVNKEY